MFERGAAGGRDGALHGVDAGGTTAAGLPETFTITAPIALQERVAASLFTYSDLFAAARRRLLRILVWLALVLLVMVGVSSWQESGRQGMGAFVSRFFTGLFSADGLPILIIVVPMLGYYALQPVVVRRRLKRWCRDEGLDRPIVATYRFEPDGLAVTLPGCSVALSCSRINGVAESPTHLFISLKDIEDVFTLPRGALSGEQIARIKAWAASCHAGAGGTAYGLAEREAPSDQQPLLTSRFQQTEDDRAVALGWQMERPGMRRRRRRGFMLAFLVTAFFMPLVFGFLWLLDPERVPLRYALPLFAEMFAETFWQYVPGFWAIIIVVIVLHPWARRRHARQLARQLQQRVQAYEQEVRLYEDRLEVRQAGWSTSFEAGSFERMDRQDKHLILIRREEEPLILPLRAFEDDKLATLERIAARRAGGENHRSEAAA